MKKRKKIHPEKTKTNSEKETKRKKSTTKPNRSK